MTANHRTIPMDELSLKEGGRTITIRKRYDEIEVGISDGWISSACFEFGEFYAALERLVRPGVAPTPSQDNKQPATARCDANSGAPEPVRWASANVGDRVRIKCGFNEGKEGVIKSIDSSGMATIRLDSWEDAVRDLCVLENLSRKEQA